MFISCSEFHHDHNTAHPPLSGAEALAGSSEAEQLINHFMTACIAFPKPLIAAVNGPAIGSFKNVISTKNYK